MKTILALGLFLKTGMPATDHLYEFKNIKCNDEVALFHDTFHFYTLDYKTRQLLRVKLFDIEGDLKNIGLYNLLKKSLHGNFTIYRYRNGECRIGYDPEE